MSWGLLSWIKTVAKFLGSVPRKIIEYLYQWCSSHHGPWASFHWLFFKTASGLHCISQTLVVQVCELSSCRMAHRLSCCIARGILVPQPGLQLSSPALEGGFLATGSPGSPSLTAERLFLFQNYMLFFYISQKKIYITSAPRINSDGFYQIITCYTALVSYILFSLLVNPLVMHTGGSICLKNCPLILWCEVRQSHCLN